jgi:predicted GTPase
VQAEKLKKQLVLVVNKIEELTHIKDIRLFYNAA